MVYIPVEDFRVTDYDRSSYPVRDFPSGKFQYSLQIFPDNDIDFNDVITLTESYNQTLLLTNNGYEKILINDLIIVGNFAIKSDIPTEIEPGESLAIEVSFTPGGIGSETGGLYIDADFAIGKKFIKFIGSGIAAPE